MKKHCDLPIYDYDHHPSSDSKERRFNVKTVQTMLLWLGSKARVHRILAMYIFSITLLLRWGSLYLVDLTKPETLVPENSSRASIQTWTMPNEMKNALERELVGLRWETKDSVASMRIFIEQAKGILTHYLQGSELLEKSLADLVDQRGALDAIILNNLPMDPLIPETPTDGSVTLNKPTFIAEAMLLAIGELAGTHAIGYSSEKHYSNPWVHEGFPRKGLVSALTATDQVPHHQDMSYQTIIPDLLGLFCLREGQDLNVQTTLLDPLTVVEQLSENIEATLRQSRFRIAAPSQWVNIDGVDDSTLRPLLQGRSLHLPVDWGNMKGADSEASEAIEMLKVVLRDADPVRVHLVDGMMLLFNNQKVVHSRTPYKQLKFDGTDRVVFRSYFSRQLTVQEQETGII